MFRCASPYSRYLTTAKIQKSVPRSSSLAPNFRLYITQRANLSSLKAIDEESLSGYDPSNFFPVRLGDVLDSQYRVKVKLGFGRSSTTWLCQDKNGAFKVLKVTTSNASTREEIMMLRLQPQHLASEHPGRYCVRQAERIFRLSSPTGSHVCFVFPPLGPSLLEYSARPRAYLQSYQVRWIVTYLLHAISFLHLNGIVHTDIKLDNIQMTLPDPEDALLDTFVKAEVESPSYAKVNDHGNTVYQSREMLQEELGFPILCDLGSAVILSDSRKSLIQALPYRAPEVILGGDWDVKVDIWNLGVLIWELLFSERLFGECGELRTIELMVRYLGSPPNNFLQQCPKAANFFDTQGRLNREQPVHVRLADRVESETAMPLLLDFLECTLKWDPMERSSASELLRHPWLQDA